MDDLIKYANKTPHNMNPNVIRGILSQLGTTSGYSNAGSGGVLMVNYSEGTADKTFQEVYDAYTSGKKVFINETSGNYLYITLVTTINSEDLSISYNNSTLIADTSDGYLYDTGGGLNL